MTEGTVKWFDASKGFGFITPNDGSPDVFAHFSSIEGSGYRELIEGQKVSFEAEQGQKGQQAKSVRSSDPRRSHFPRPGAPRRGSRDSAPTLCRLRPFPALGSGSRRSSSRLGARGATGTISDSRRLGPRCNTPARWYSRRWSDHSPSSTGSSSLPASGAPSWRRWRGHTLPSSEDPAGRADLHLAPARRSAPDGTHRRSPSSRAAPSCTSPNPWPQPSWRRSCSSGQPHSAGHLTQRFVHDFCPIDPELLARPRVRQFFVEISLLWATVLMVNAGITLWLLLSSSLRTFVLERTAATWGLTAWPSFCRSRGSCLPCARTALRSNGVATASRGPSPPISTEPGRLHRASHSWSGSARPSRRPGRPTGDHGVPASQPRPPLHAIRPGRAGLVQGLTWMLVGIRPRQWVAVHRKHHAFTDTPRDPHSPLVLGFARVLFANAFLYRKAARDPCHHRQIRPGPAGGPMGPGALQSRRHRPRAWGSVCWCCSSGGNWPSSPRVSMPRTTCSGAARSTRSDTDGVVDRTTTGRPTISGSPGWSSARGSTTITMPRPLRAGLASLRARSTRHGGASGCWCGCAGRRCAQPAGIQGWYRKTSAPLWPSTGQQWIGTR